MDYTLLEQYAGFDCIPIMPYAHYTISTVREIHVEYDRSHRGATV